MSLDEFAVIGAARSAVRQFLAAAEQPDQIVRDVPVPAPRPNDGRRHPSSSRGVGGAS